MENNYVSTFLCDKKFHASDQKVDIYQINIYWGENEKNGLNNEKRKRVKVLYFKSKLWQLKFQCTHELHN